MSFTKKNIKYADLIVPFINCPLGEPVQDCPFTEYWKIDDETKQINLVDELPEQKLIELQLFHRKCLNQKIEETRKKSTQIYKT